MNVYVVREGLDAILRSVTRDNDVGNAAVTVVVESGMQLGFDVDTIEQVGGDADAPLMVQTTRRSLAAALLEALDAGVVVIDRPRGGAR